MLHETITCSWLFNFVWFFFSWISFRQCWFLLVFICHFLLIYFFFNWYFSWRFRIGASEKTKCRLFCAHILANFFYHSSVEKETSLRGYFSELQDLIFILSFTCLYFILFVCLFRLFAVSCDHSRNIHGQTSIEFACVVLLLFFVLLFVFFYICTFRNDRFLTEELAVCPLYYS